MTGKVEILGTGATTTISLNGDNGNITAGMNGANGVLVLRDSSSNVWPGVLINSHNRSFIINRMFTPEKQGAYPVVTLSGASGTVAVGGHGQDGDVGVYPAVAEGSGIHQNLTNATIHLRGSDGVIRAGGATVADGEVLVWNKANETTIRLRGSDGTIRSRVAILRDEKRNEIVRLTSDPAGDNFLIRDASGKRLLAYNNQAFNNTKAGLFIGAHSDDDGGKPGVLALRDDEGKDSVLLDGASGDIILKNADCAEEFEIAEPERIEPGAVVVFDEDCKIKQCSHPYDRKVAGVVAGAGNCKPAIILGKNSAQPNRMPVALIGRVYCKADSQYSPISVGDLLTTSPTLGHAMCAKDNTKAFGAVIGKALSSLEAGQGLVRILVTLQ